MKRKHLPSLQIERYTSKMRLTTKERSLKIESDFVTSIVEVIGEERLQQTQISSEVFSQFLKLWEDVRKRVLGSFSK